MAEMKITEEHKDLFLRVAKRVREGWCQNTSAETEDGVWVRSHDPRAARWCLSGAFAKEVLCSDGDLPTCNPACHKWHHILRKVVGCMDLIAWNDAADRTQDEVVDALLKVAYSGDDLMGEFAAAPAAEAEEA